MSDGKLELAKSCLLTKLHSEKDQKQAEKKIRTYVEKELGLEAATLDGIIDQLLRDQMVARLTKGKTTSYQMTPAATEYLKTLPAYPPPPPAPDEKVKCLVLMELAAAGETSLNAKEIAAGISAAMTKALGIAKPMVAPALAYFVSQAWAQGQPTDKKGKDEKIAYRLTDRGKQELAQVPETDKALFPHLTPPTPEMQTFVLMEMLAAGDRRLLKAEVEKVLAKPAGKLLGMIKQMAAPLLASLIREKWAAEELAERSGKTAYLLTDLGKQELAKGGQHPAAVFSLSGAVINELLRHAGAAAPAAMPVQHAKPQSVHPVTHEQVPLAHPAASPTVEHATAPPAAQFTDDALIGEAKELLRERHGHTGLVPIFELRRRVLDKFGAQFASHGDLDGRIKRLRREHRLRLVSISDRSRATPQELSESVPGEEEMFFYVGELR
jgi:DNA-binding PadR family transcriptional regulator